MLPIFDVMSNEDVLRIEDASFTVLEKTGIYLDHPKAQEVLSGLGAKISDDRKRVFLPRDLVKKMLAKTPSEFICGARLPEFELEIKQGQLYMRQVGGPTHLFDLNANTITPLTLKDCQDVAKLVNALPNINVASTLTPQDIHSELYDIAAVKGMLETCHKHFWALTTDSTHLEYQLKMAEVVAGGRGELKNRPLLSGIFCVIEPLRYPYDEIDRLMLYGQYGIPLRVPITSLVGANSPYPMAGTMTQVNAEFLSSLTIIQAMCPGLGLWYNPLIQVLDMRNGHSIYNGPETMLLYAAVSQMARHYQVPSAFSSGTLTETQAHQLMFHYGTTHTLGVMLQITEQVGAGSIQGSTYFSPQGLVLSDEFMGYLKPMQNGINVTDETLAVEDIDKCFEQGEYVSSKLTLKYLRREKHHTTDLLDWRQLSSWQENPNTIVDRADAKIKKILSQAEVVALPADKQAELDKIMKEAEKAFI